MDRNEELAQVWNVFRMRYQGQNVSIDIIKAAVKSCGMGWSCSLPRFLINNDCIVKTGGGRTTKWSFPINPVYKDRLGKAFDEHLAYNRAASKRHYIHRRITSQLVQPSEPVNPTTCTHDVIVTYV